MEDLKKKTITVQGTSMPRMDMEEILCNACGFTGNGQKGSQYYNTSLICFGHSRYSDLNRHPDWVDVATAFSFDDHISKLEKANPKFVIRPVYMYRHSCTILEWHPSNRWDSGALGCIAVRRKRGGRESGYDSAIENAFRHLNNYWFSEVYEFEDEDGAWVGPLCFDDVVEVVKEVHGNDCEIKFC